MAQMVEHLLCKQPALTSNPSPTMANQKTRKKERKKKKKNKTPKM
jgi:hypothetical protein